DNAFDLAEHRVGGGAGGGDGGERAHAFAVQAEVFGEAAAHEQLGAGPGQFKQAVRVFTKPVAEALVSEVDKRKQFAFSDDVGDLVPLGGQGIDAAGIVAAAVQQDDIA